MESLRRTCRGGIGSKAGTGLASIAFGYPKRSFGENPKPPDEESANRKRCLNCFDLTRERPVTQAVMYPVCQIHLPFSITGGLQPQKEICREHPLESPVPRKLRLFWG